MGKLFQKGHTPWNKGIKTGIIPKSAFKKGHPSGRRKKEILWEINENGCWICTSHAPDTKGYPQARIDGKKKQISRLFYEDTHGPIPEGFHILHKCDQPACINPEHLFAGTNADNVADKVSKNRQSRMPGEKHPMVKLTEKQVEEIRQAENMTCRSLAKKYGVHYSTIAYIRKGKLWNNTM